MYNLINNSTSERLAGVRCPAGSIWCLYYNIFLISTKILIWKPISAKTRYILQWMKCVSHEKRCIFQVQRCIFQLVRCIFLSGGQIETYISFSKWRPPDRNNTSQQLKYTSLLMIIYILFWH